MSHRLHRLPIGCLVRVGKPLLDQLLSGQRMTTFRQAREVLWINVAAKPEMFGEAALPFAADAFALRVIRLRAACELLRVVLLGLAGAKRLRDRQHHSKYGSCSTAACG